MNEMDMLCFMKKRFQKARSGQVLKEYLESMRNKPEGGEQ